jgi:hypothetical protein
MPPPWHRSPLPLNSFVKGRRELDIRTRERAGAVRGKKSLVGHQPSHLPARVGRSRGARLLARGDRRGLRQRRRARPAPRSNDRLLRRLHPGWRRQQDPGVSVPSAERASDGVRYAEALASALGGDRPAHLLFCRWTPILVRQCASPRKEQRHHCAAHHRTVERQLGLMQTGIGCD